jgi:hypothetical protein
MSNLYELFTKIAPLSLLLENKRLLKLFIENKSILKRMNIDDLFFLMDEMNSPSSNRLLGGSPKTKRTFEEFKEITKGLCSVTTKAIIYSFRGIISTSELCIMAEDIIKPKDMNLEEILKDYSNALEYFKRCETTSGRKEARCALRPRAVKPNDLSGYLVHTHGGLYDTKLEFEIPKNTYIVYLTELGKFGYQRTELLDILSNAGVYQEFLYLLTFDFGDEYFKNLSQHDYFNQRVVYGPHSICPDSLINLSDYEEVNCLTYFDGLEMPLGKFSTNLLTTPAQVRPFMAPKGMGIYELPITDRNDSKPKEILINYKDTTTGTEIRDDRSIDKMKVINPNLEYSIKDVPYYIDYTYNIIQNNAGDLIATTPYHDKSDSTWEANFNKKYPNWTTVLHRDKYYSCSARMFDDPAVTPRTYKTVVDLNDIINPAAADKTNMRFSDCVYYLRGETDRNKGVDQRLVILTGKCRSMAGLSTDVISGCLKLENTSITLMNLMERTPEESEILEECFEKFKRHYSLKNMNRSFPEKHSGPNTATTDRRTVKAKRPRI